jgi:hypothetical protein
MTTHVAQLHPCYALLQRRSEVQTCEGTSAMNRGDVENLFFPLHLTVLCCRITSWSSDLQRALFELFLFSTCPFSAIFLETL